MPASISSGIGSSEEIDSDKFVDMITGWLSLPAGELDVIASGVPYVDAIRGVGRLNAEAESGNPAALYSQQLLLARIYKMHTVLPSRDSAEGSVLIHHITRLLEESTLRQEDACIEPGLIDQAPSEPRAFLSWLKTLAREHRVYKHPYYLEFIRNDATATDLRQYVMQESVVDGRFDDLLAMMQVGTSGAAKMEIAANFWDEMGNGDPEQVHTSLFNEIFKVFEIPAAELERSLTANALLSGNLAVLLSRYRRLYPEAVGFLGMTEWLVPHRFTNVVHAWERLGLPEAGIVYHRLHVTIDSQHAAGWFRNVVIPAAESEYMRRGIARGTLLRLHSSARYLDERMPVPVA